MSTDTGVITHEDVVRAMGDLDRPSEKLVLYPENLSTNLTHAHRVGGLIPIMASAGLVLRAAATFLDVHPTIDEKVIEIGDLKVTLFRSEVPGKYHGRVDYMGPYGHSTLAKLTLGPKPN